MITYLYRLSYTSFTYSNLQLNATQIYRNQTIAISFTITNVGKFDGKETAMVFLNDNFATVTPEVMMLKRFKKVLIPAGQAVNLTFDLNAADLTFIGRDNKVTLETGGFTVIVSNLSANFTLV